MIKSIGVIFVGFLIQNAFTLENATTQLSTEQHIRLSEQTHMTFHQNAYVNGSRSIKQLNCIENEGLQSIFSTQLCRENGLNSITCENEGYPYGEVRWRCDFTKRAYLRTVKFSIDCEKVKHSIYQDEVINGSCSLTYSLEIVSKRLIHIDELNLEKGKQTIGRKPANQLNCINNNIYDRNNLCPIYAPRYVKCTNIGYIRGGIRWECKAEFRDNVHFDKMDVSCEKINDRYDDMVIDGSCLLNYTLEQGSDITVPVIIVLLMIIMFIFIILIAYHYNNRIEQIGVYSDHSQHIIPKKPIYTIPMQSTTTFTAQPIRPVYSSPPYRKNKVKKSTGYAKTSFRNYGYSSGGNATTSTSTSYATTSYR